MAFTSTVSYDALNRVKLMTYPQDVENKRRKLRPQYNRASALESVALEGDIFVERIAYNAKGQRALIAYGNGIMTRYAYDPQTFRLLHLRTEPYNKPSELLYRHTGHPQQELAYEFDLVGNILTILERTPGCGIPNTTQGVDALDRKFIYDAIYRLRSATGRECDRPSDIPWDDTPRCTDITKTRSYTEQYLYDFAGNIKQLKHVANGTGPSRDFGLAPGNNRLLNVTVGLTAFGYAYDYNGNMTAETSSRHFEWDSADRMRVYRTQTLASEPSVYAQYLYDSGGQRTKKVVRKQGGQVEVAVYIDGVFEYQRIVRANTVAQNNTVHVVENKSRVALVRVGTPFENDTTPAVKYPLGDHLGSSNVVLDGKGELINREEYTPYGNTSFGSFALKRYRFTGKERDEETEFSYHGARYYASWLGRWISCDPAGIVDGPDLYEYVGGNPIRFHDPNGEEGESVHATIASNRQFVAEVLLARRELNEARTEVDRLTQAYNEAFGRYDASLRTKGFGEGKAAEELKAAENALTKISEERLPALENRLQSLNKPSPDFTPKTGVGGGTRAEQLAAVTEQELSTNAFHLLDNPDLGTALRQSIAEVEKAEPLIPHLSAKLAETRQVAKAAVSEARGLGRISTVLKDARLPGAGRLLGVAGTALLLGEIATADTPEKSQAILAEAVLIPVALGWKYNPAHLALKYGLGFNIYKSAGRALGQAIPSSSEAAKFEAAAKRDAERRKARASE